MITGRVTAGDKPVPDIPVLLLPGDYGPDRRAVARTTTDADGTYRLTNVPAGRFNVSPIAPTMTGPGDGMLGMMGRSLIISEGETVDKIDFTLTRGGVVTGRITDAEGKPVIEERVQLTPANNQERGRYGFYTNSVMFQTDDRGIYRIYGIPAGRYTISVGVAPEYGMSRGGILRRGYYQLTFYPGETDAKKAAVIEVTEGGELKDIDIKLGRQSQTFTVSGRLIDADTGNPLSGIPIGYGSYRPEEKRVMAVGYNQPRTDSRGRFSIEGVLPGRYAAFVWGGGETESYGEPVAFQVTDADVGNVELKMRRGGSISGFAQIEGTTDKKILARLQQLLIGVSVQSNGISPPIDRNVKINADGSFRIMGLSPGKVMLFQYGDGRERELRLARVERDGTPQPEGIELAPGAEVTNIRVVFEYGSASLRGQVRIENGTLPEGVRLFILIEKPGDEPRARGSNFAPVDARGRFLFEGLSTGDYQLILRAMVPNGVRIKLPEVKQNISLSNGMEAETTLVLDLSDKAEGNNNQ
jgi:protocatechuate 3,4-dioxygenase beta subunit